MGSTTISCKDQVAQNFGIMVPTQFRVFYTRENTTCRPGKPVSSSISLLPLASLNGMSAGDIKLYLEEFSGDCAESAIREGKILVFLKLYDPKKSKLRYVGALYVDINSRVSDIEPTLKEIACIDEQKEILLYEEIKMNPNVMCLQIATEYTFLFNEFKDGDIICYQENPNVPASYAYPYVPQFLQHMHDMKNVMRALKEENLMLKGRVDAYRLESENIRADCNRMEEILNWNSVFILEFRPSTLHDATNGFQSERLFQDNEYGRVYRGMIDGTDVAIKISSSKALFEHEVAIHHKYRRSSNTLKLLGRCSEAMSFVFSLPSKGCLQDYVVSDSGIPVSALKWYDRIRIAVEVCSALVTVHSCQPSLPHGDVRPCNIMLDGCFRAKLCNIGMGCEFLKSGALPPDMRPYLDPEYLSSSEITPFSDVYSLGILVMCMLTGKPPVNIAATIRNALQENSLHSVLDWSAGCWPHENALQLVKLALRCVQTPKSSRPDMTMVLAELEALNLEVQEDRIPEEYMCPISKVIMEDPHIAEDGNTYEKKAITQWFADTVRSPLTNMNLQSKKLVPNLILRSMIKNYKERCGQH